MIHLESRLNHLDRLGMDDAVTTITRSGASGSLLAEFKAIEEATSSNGQPKYAKTPIMSWLAKFIIGQAGGPNKDTPVFELCHLVSVLDALGPAENRSDNRSVFFLGVDRALPNFYRAEIQNRLSEGDWRWPGFAADDNGVFLEFSEEEDDFFEIRYGRIPFLAALFELLLGLDGYDFYQELNDIFDEMSDGEVDREAIKTASNRISARLRSYRRDHLSSTQYDEKFDRIAGFLKSREDGGQWRIDDPAILDFWVEYSASGDFRTYKLVFDSFVTFMRSLDDAGSRETLETAATIGSDFEAREVEPDDGVDSLWAQGEWQTPLALLDLEPLSGINFLKKESERKPIDNLMQYGPYASKLPLAFLRLESFAPVQTAITNDLQIKRGQASVRQRLTCQEAASYSEKQETFDQILDHIHNLQKALYYVLSVEQEGNVVQLHPQTPEQLFEEARSHTELNDNLPQNMSELLQESRRAFVNMYRKGFDEEDLNDPENLETYRVGAGIMVTIAGQMENYLAHLKTISGKTDLEKLFEQDRAIFSSQFTNIYGEAA